MATHSSAARGATVTPPAGSTNDFTLDVTAIATETANSATASTMASLAVGVRVSAMLADGFESGTTEAWAGAEPAGFVAFAALSAAEVGRFGFGYDLAALEDAEPLAPTAIGT